MTKYVDKIKSISKKVITVDELQSLFQQPDYDLFFSEVINCITNGFLEPVKASKTNGRFTNVLFNRYRILNTSTDFSLYTDKIKRLNPKS